MMIDDGINVEAAFVGMLNLAHDLPDLIVVRLAGRSLNFAIDSEAHDVSKAKLEARSQIEGVPLHRIAEDFSRLHRTSSFFAPVRQSRPRSAEHPSSGGTDCGSRAAGHLRGRR